MFPPIMIMRFTVISYLAFFNKFYDSVIFSPCLSAFRTPEKPDLALISRA